MSKPTRKYDYSNDESSEWTERNTIDWIIVGILFASLVFGVMLMFELNTKSGQGIKYIGLTMGIGCLICTFVEKGKQKKLYLVLSIFLLVGSILMLLLS